MNTSVPAEVSKTSGPHAYMAHKFYGETMDKYLKLLPCLFLLAFVIKFMFLPASMAEAIIFVSTSALYIYHLIKDSRSKEEKEEMLQCMDESKSEMLSKLEDWGKSVQDAHNSLVNDVRQAKENLSSLMARNKLDQQVVSTKKKRHF